MNSPVLPTQSMLGQRASTAAKGGRGVLGAWKPIERQVRCNKGLPNKYKRLQISANIYNRLSKPRKKVTIPKPTDPAGPEDSSQMVPERKVPTEMQREQAVRSKLRAQLLREERVKALEQRAMELRAMEAKALQEEIKKEREAEEKEVRGHINVSAASGVYAYRLRTKQERGSGAALQERDRKTRKLPFRDTVKTTLQDPVYGIFSGGMPSWSILVPPKSRSINRTV
eukprot:6480464-Pyramimonas_sp.AAC.1